MSPLISASGRDCRDGVSDSLRRVFDYSRQGKDLFVPAAAFRKFVSAMGEESVKSARKVKE
jgi:hypothetical protein